MITPKTFEGFGSQVAVACDLGGSGIRLCFVDVRDNERSVTLPHIPVQTASGLKESLGSLSSSIKELYPEMQVVGGALAAAGKRDGTVITVMSWQSEDDRVFDFSKLPLFPPNSVLLNDLEAGAYGVFASPNHFERVFGDSDQIVCANTGVLALGSGLGAAVLIPPRNSSENAMVLATEMGWALAPRPTDPKAIAVWEAQATCDGMIGPVYEQLARFPPHYESYTGVRLEAGEIAKLAQGGDSTAEAAMIESYRWAMLCSRQLAIGFGCKSVLLALSNQVKNLWLMRKAAGALREAFLEPGITVWTQNEDFNFNLVGAAHKALELARTWLTTKGH